MAFETPAVVVGAGINGLGVARSLKRAGVPVYVLDADPNQPAMCTRAARPVRIATLHGEGLIDELARLGTTRFADQRPVLLLTQEESVRHVSDLRERLAPLYRFTLPPKATLEALQHKYAFQRLAEELDCPIPPLVRVKDASQLPALGNLHYPVVVKPGERNDAYGRLFKKAYRVGSAAEAIELVRRIVPVMPDVVVQEWTEGPDSNIHFCLQYIDASGQVTASFTGRKIRSWPPQVGGTASCAPAPEAHAELSALTERFFRDAGARGMAAMEYKRDERTHAFRMVEPTIGRTDYQAEIACLNGVNLPFAAYCAELGLPFPDPVRAIRPTAWRVRSEDVQSAAAQRQSPSAGFGNVDRVADALWRAFDPMPWLAQNGQRVRRALRTRIVRPRPQAGSGSQPAGSKS